MKKLKAIDIEKHFISLADWVDPNWTVDGIIVGDPDKDVHRVLVTWISSFEAVKIAVEREFDMLITHEPTFWFHVGEKSPGDEASKSQQWAFLQHRTMKQQESGLLRKLGSAKKTFIEQNGLVVLRNHDVWDRMPEIGIPWAWARFLGLEGKPVVIEAKGCQHRYDIDPLHLDDLAEKIAERTATIGEPNIQVIGDGSSKVSKVGVGTGCACSIFAYLEMGCDVSIVCDDGSKYFSDIQYAIDSNHPVIRVNHGTSEEPGMVTLTKYINDNLSIKAVHLPHRSCYHLVKEKRV